MHDASSGPARPTVAYMHHSLKSVDSGVLLKRVPEEALTIKLPHAIGQGCQLTCNFHKPFKALDTYACSLVL